ncbi:MAG: hypothetical protein OXN89_10575 [Bryobacterales bacterium]|nr:hypothetical protein [Bryobacterales bacterium]
MSAELIAILGVGVSLLGVMLRQGATQRADIGELAKRVSEHGERLARIEGLLEGLGLQRGDRLAAGD